MSEKVYASVPPTPGTEPYWEGAKAGKLMVQFCKDCKKPHHYPRGICPHCFSTNLEWKQAKGTGEVYTYSIMQAAKRAANASFFSDGFSGGAQGLIGRISGYDTGVEERGVSLSGAEGMGSLLPQQQADKETDAEGGQNGLHRLLPREILSLCAEIGDLAPSIVEGFVGIFAVLPGLFPQFTGFLLGGGAELLRLLLGHGSKLLRFLRRCGSQFLRCL